MKVIGLNRVELVVEDPDKEAQRLADLCGMSFATDHTEDDGHNVLSRTDWTAGLELAGPMNDTSVMRHLLDATGEGLLTIVFRVESVDDVRAEAKAKGIAIQADLDFGDFMPGYKNYRQISLAGEAFPAGVSFTFAEYDEA